MASAAEQLASNLNFSTFAKAEDLKKRLWFTLAALLVYRLGTHIPLPGLNPDAYAAAFRGQSGGILVCSTCSRAVLWSAWRSSRSASCLTSPPRSSCS